MSTKKKFEYYFVVGEKAQIVKVKYTQIDDGLNSTVRFPQVGEIVVLKRKYYRCEMVTHDYDHSAIGFHLIDVQLKDKPTEDA